MPTGVSVPRSSGEKKVTVSKCSYCDMTFKKLEHAQRHERTHTRQRPYQCSACAKTFARQDTLNRHFRLHTRETGIVMEPPRKKKSSIAQLKKTSSTDSSTTPKPDLTQSPKSVSPRSSPSAKTSPAPRGMNNNTNRKSISKSLNNNNSNNNNNNNNNNHHNNTAASSNNNSNNTSYNGLGVTHQQHPQQLSSSDYTLASPFMGLSHPNRSISNSSDYLQQLHSFNTTNSEHNIGGQQQQQQHMPSYLYSPASSHASNGSSLPSVPSQTPGLPGTINSASATPLTPGIAPEYLGGAPNVSSSSLIGCMSSPSSYNNNNNNNNNQQVSPNIIKSTSNSTNTPSISSSTTTNTTISSDFLPMMNSHHYHKNTNNATTTTNMAASFHNQHQNNTNALGPVELHPSLPDVFVDRSSSSNSCADSNNNNNNNNNSCSSSSSSCSSVSSTNATTTTTTHHKPNNNNNNNNNNNSHNLWLPAFNISNPPSDDTRAISSCNPSDTTTLSNSPMPASPSFTSASSTSTSINHNHQQYHPQQQQEQHHHHHQRQQQQYNYHTYFQKPPNSSMPSSVSPNMNLQSPITSYETPTISDDRSLLFNNPNPNPNLSPPTSTAGSHITPLTNTSCGDLTLPLPSTDSRAQNHPFLSYGHQEFSNSHRNNSLDLELGYISPATSGNNNSNNNNQLLRNNTNYNNNIFANGNNGDNYNPTRHLQGSENHTSPTMVNNNYDIPDYGGFKSNNVLGLDISSEDNLSLKKESGHQDLQGSNNGGNPYFQFQQGSLPMQQHMQQNPQQQHQKLFPPSPPLAEDEQKFDGFKHALFGGNGRYLLSSNPLGHDTDDLRFGATTTTQARSDGYTF